MKEILVIDNNEEISEFCKQGLEKEYTVTLTKTGEEGLKKINQKPFDLVLLDLRLQDMDGIAVLEIIKSLFPQCPVIIVSNYTTLRYQTQAERLGVFDYIFKPFIPEKLLESIERAISKNEKRRNTDMD